MEKSPTPDNYRGGGRRTRKGGGGRLDKWTIIKRAKPPISPYIREKENTFPDNFFPPLLLPTHHARAVGKGRKRSLCKGEEGGGDSAKYCTACHQSSMNRGFSNIGQQYEQSDFSLFPREGHLPFSHLSIYLFCHLLPPHARS